jgi:hypothetical protein
MVAVGLDRMLRIYDANTHRQLQCAYLKQRLCSVLLTDEGLSGDEEEELGDDEGSDVDQEDVVRDYVDSSDEEVSSSSAAQEEEIGGVNEESEESSEEEDDESSEEESLPRKRKR